MLTVSGRSFSDPVYKADGTIDAAASRRVEINFRLKDEEMISEMMEILNKSHEEESAGEVLSETPLIHPARR